jgi:hypothetical protein
MLPSQLVTCFRCRYYCTSVWIRIHSALVLGFFTKNVPFNMPCGGTVIVMVWVQCTRAWLNSLSSIYIAPEKWYFPHPFSDLMAPEHYLKYCPLFALYIDRSHESPVLCLGTAHYVPPLKESTIYKVEFVMIWSSLSCTSLWFISSIY